MADADADTLLKLVQEGNFEAIKSALEANELDEMELLTLQGQAQNLAEEKRTFLGSGPLLPETIISLKAEISNYVEIAKLLEEKIAVLEAAQGEEIVSSEDIDFEEVKVEDLSLATQTTEEIAPEEEIYFEEVALPELAPPLDEDVARTLAAFHEATADQALEDEEELSTEVDSAAVLANDVGEEVAEPAIAETVIEEEKYLVGVANAIMDGDNDKLKDLLEKAPTVIFLPKRFDINETFEANTASGPAEFSLVILAVYEGNLEAIKLLEAHGADINMVMKDETFALGVAAAHGDHEIVSFLLKNGANTKIQCQGKNAAEIARMNGNDSIATLIEHHQHFEDISRERYLEHLKADKEVIRLGDKLAAAEKSSINVYQKYRGIVDKLEELVSTLSAELDAQKGKTTRNGLLGLFGSVVAGAAGLAGGFIGAVKTGMDIPPPQPEGAEVSAEDYVRASYEVVKGSWNEMYKKAVATGGVVDEKEFAQMSEAMEEVILENGSEEAVKRIAETLSQGQGK